MTDTKAIEKMNDAEVAKFIENKREEIRSFRFGTGGRNVSAVKTAKKEIARALTALNTRVKAAQKAK